MSGDRDYALLRRLADGVPSMLAYWDADLRCRYANRAYEIWFGRSPESMIGMHIRDLLGPALYELNRPYIERAIRGERVTFERDVPDPAGGPARHSLARYMPDVDEDGRVRGFIVSVTDIGPVKDAQRRLAASEAKLSSIVEISLDAIVGADAHQRITVFNRGAELMFGYARDEVLGKSIDLLVPARLRDPHHEQVAAFIASDEKPRRWHQGTVPTRAVRKSGEEFPAEASISKVDAGGEPMLIVVLRDISERVAREADEKMLAEATIVLTSSLDYKGTLRTLARLVVEHLAEFCTIDMFDEERALTRLILAHADPALTEICERLAALPLDPAHTMSGTVLATGELKVFDELTPSFLSTIVLGPEHLALAERLAARSAIVVPLVIGEQTIGAVTMAATQPHRFGPREISLAGELGRRAAIAIHNARLFEAAQRATRARDDVLGVVAHDLRSPLNAIQLATKTLERQAVVMEQPRARQAVEMVSASLKRAHRLIADLLDVGRIDAGALSVAKQPVELAPAVAAALSAHEMAAGEATVALHDNVGDDLPLLAGDHERIVQVLDNLVGNALRFTPPGGSITVGAVPQDGELRVSVADTGAGIPPDHLAHIFDRFWQSDRTRRSGAGLGLAICKGIVEAHGGRIWAESVPGAGTTFFFTLPFASDGAPQRDEGHATSRELA
ncbi:MAG TPA: PAS domain S-box protein [Kofleriaceae bacterium]|nr:PAS domain S-box protein [Kofleriaceae bacterium]